MKNEDIATLRAYCDGIAQFRDNTVNGSGNNLFDIKNSFDYVIKTVKNYQLEGTTFGKNLSTKAEASANILVELASCLKELENSITSFCDQQEKNNNTV